MVMSKARLIAMTLAVMSLGVILGTFLWLKLTPGQRYGAANSEPLEGLNHFGRVPDFNLTERSGSPAGLSTLRGKVWVADFIYTNCTDTCPLQSAALAKIQDQWRNHAGVRFVSFSVDPERDTPAVLADYARHFGADVNRWLFLTGSKETISRLIEQGFRLSATPALDNGSEGVIIHSPRFVLVDKAAEIRGYYDSRDPDALNRMNSDMATLLADRKE